MKIVIIYDSIYGNTEKIAKALGKGIKGQVKILKVGNAKLKDLRGINLLIIGSPTHGGRPTLGIQNFLTEIPAKSLEGIKVAAFDTRFAPEEHGLGLKIIMRIIKFAAPRIAKSLEDKGGMLSSEPEGFIVEDKQGPLKKGEIERATEWAKVISVA